MSTSFLNKNCENNCLYAKYISILHITLNSNSLKVVAVNKINRVYIIKYFHKLNIYIYYKLYNITIY